MELLRPMSRVAASIVRLATRTMGLCKSGPSMSM